MEPFKPSFPRDIELPGLAAIRAQAGHQEALLHSSFGKTSQRQAAQAVFH
jgi:hypothetical protein